MKIPFYSVFDEIRREDFAVGALLMSLIIGALFTVDWKPESFHASALQAKEIEVLNERIEELEEKISTQTTSVSQLEL